MIQNSQSPSLTSGSPLRPSTLLSAADVSSFCGGLREQGLTWVSLWCESEYVACVSVWCGCEYVAWASVWCESQCGGCTVAGCTVDVRLLIYGGCTVDVRHLLYVQWYNTQLHYLSTYCRIGMPLPLSAGQLLLCRCIAGPALDDRDADVSRHCRRCGWSVSLDHPFTLSDPQMLFAVILHLQQRVDQLEDEAALVREARTTPAAPSASISSSFVPEPRVSWSGSEESSP